MLNLLPCRSVRFARSLAVPMLLAFCAGWAASVPGQAAAQTAAQAAPSHPSQTPASEAARGAGRPTKAYQIIVSSENCPVQFSAQRWGPGTVENVRGGSAAPEERGLLLHFHALGKDLRVLQATAIVHGSNYRPHIDPADSSSTGNLTQTFHLADAERDDQGDWRLTTDQVPLVKEIDIVAMRFADGTTWKQSRDASCRIQPDGFLLVATSR